MTILEPSAEWSNPFTRTTTPTIGRVVLYHADVDVVWPAIISEVRAQLAGQHLQLADYTVDSVVKGLEDSFGPIDVLAHLTIFRPNRVEWKWASQGDGVAQWSWPVIRGAK